MSEVNLTHKEGIGDRFRRAIQRLGAEASRATGLARMKLQLNRLHVELRDREIAMGRKLALLKRRGVVKDKFLLEAMKEEFEALADCERRIESVLTEMHDYVSLELPEKSAGTTATGVASDEKPSELDSFEVS